MAAMLISDVTFEIPCKLFTEIPCLIMILHQPKVNNNSIRSWCQPYRDDEINGAETSLVAKQPLCIQHKFESCSPTRQQEQAQQAKTHSQSYNKQ
jgi:hypothetical protein